MEYFAVLVNRNKNIKIQRVSLQFFPLRGNKRYCEIFSTLWKWNQIYKELKKSYIIFSSSWKFLYFPFLIVFTIWIQDKSLSFFPLPGNKMHWWNVKQLRKSGNYLYFVQIEGVVQYLALCGNKIKYINKYKKLLHFFHFVEIKTLYSFWI